jgi:hypothetical protein
MLDYENLENQDVPLSRVSQCSCQPNNYGFKLLNFCKKLNCVLGYVHLTAKDRNLVFRILSLRKTILTTSKNSLRHLCFCKFFFRFLYPGLQLGLRRSPGINELVYFTHHVIRCIVKYFSYR